MPIVQTERDADAVAAAVAPATGAAPALAAPVRLPPEQVLRQCSGYISDLKSRKKDEIEMMSGRSFDTTLLDSEIRPVRGSHRVHTSSTLPRLQPPKQQTNTGLGALRQSGVGHRMSWQVMWSSFSGYIQVLMLRGCAAYISGSACHAATCFCRCSRAQTRCVRSTWR